jgi:hypothetical protein
VLSFHITRSTSSIRPASNDFTSLRGNHGNTCVLRHPLANNHPRKCGEASESKMPEPNTAIEPDSNSESIDLPEHNTEIEFDDIS